jgi:DNA-binding NarL/FixJ family response regulator
VWLPVRRSEEASATIRYVPTTIVIVDDDPRFRGIARRLLESEGFDVIGEAADGREALAVAQELEPDVVLLDVQLPDIDGIEVATRLSSAGDGPAIVLTSTRDESDFGPRVEQSGARGFVPKGEISAERITSLCE